jgi:hypothetical protein
MPGLLVRSAPWVRRIFDHAWAPMQALGDHVRRLPAELLDHLLVHPGGYVAITGGESQYITGPASLRGVRVTNVAHISVEDLARDTERPLHVIGHLIDHHLGCGGASEGPWLSEGGGTLPVWKAAGARLPALFALGYGIEVGRAQASVAPSNVRDYFAQSLALYCRDRQHLNVADPQITKLLRSTLWNQAFWRAVDSQELGKAQAAGKAQSGRG